MCNFCLQSLSAELIRKPRNFIQLFYRSFETYGMNAKNVKSVLLQKSKDFFFSEQSFNEIKMIKSVRLKCINFEKLFFKITLNSF